MAALPEEGYTTRDILIDRDGTWHLRGMPVPPMRSLSQVDVVLNALHGGIGEDGNSQMGLEDIALLRPLPNFTILQPADDLEARQAVAWSAEHKGPVYLRPMSEMNDAAAAWQLATHGTGNTPGRFARAWCRLHSVFDREGASNVLFMFNVMSGSTSPMRGDRIRKTLTLIPPAYIDALGIHPYARAQQPGAEPLPFSRLVEPWMRLFAEAGHPTTPVIIGEMGVSGNPLPPSHPRRNDPAALSPGTPAYQQWDEARARWIREAFASAAGHGLPLVTYFDQLDTHWRVDPGSRAHQALRQEIERYGLP